MLHSSSVRKDRGLFMHMGKKDLALSQPAPGHMNLFEKKGKIP
jgi:hypothetical protein